MPIVLDGKALADKICADLKNRVDSLRVAGVAPKLTIVTSGDDSASKVYVRNKVRRAEEIGIDVEVVHHDFLGITKAISAYNHCPIIYQMPMHGFIGLGHLDAIIKNSGHDVDGFVSSVNVSTLARGVQPDHSPCTPKGIMRLLAEHEIDPKGKHVCIIGRSNIVGRPLARMMEQADATVTLCHSKTPEARMYELVSGADIVVCATGKRNLLELDRANIVTCWNMDWSGKVIVDVGINRDDNGKICGDVDPKIFGFCRAYTPVPGGVGPMTVAMLMENVVEYYEKMLHET